MLISGYDFLVLLKIQAPFDKKSVTGAIVALDGATSVFHGPAAIESRVGRRYFGPQGTFNGGAACDVKDPLHLQPEREGEHPDCALCDRKYGRMTKAIGTMKVGATRRGHRSFIRCRRTRSARSRCSRGWNDRRGDFRCGRSAVRSQRKARRSVETAPLNIVLPTTIDWDTPFAVKVQYNSEKAKVTRLFLKIVGAKSYEAYVVGRGGRFR